MINGNEGLGGQAESWARNATAMSGKQAGKTGSSHNKAGSVEKTSWRSSGTGGGRRSGASNTLTYDLAAIDAILSGKVADYNERLKRAQSDYAVGRLRAQGQRDDALRKAYIAARQASRVLPQELAGRGAGGGLSLQGSRRIAVDYQNKRRAAHKDYDAQHDALQQAFAAEESKVRGLIAKAQAAAQADRIEAMAKAVKR